MTKSQNYGVSDVINEEEQEESLADPLSAMKGQKSQNLNMNNSSERN